MMLIDLLSCRPKRLDEDFFVRHFSNEHWERYQIVANPAGIGCFRRHPTTVRAVRGLTYTYADNAAWYRDALGKLPFERKGDKADSRFIVMIPAESGNLTGKYVRYAMPGQRIMLEIG